MRRRPRRHRPRRRRRPPRPKATTTTEESTTTSSSSTSTSTTVAPDPVMPLTGLPITDPALAARPAVVVKVSNDPGARPQSGLDYADIVFEAWGAGPTRFATVFQSKDAPEGRPHPLGAHARRRPGRFVQRRRVRLLGRQRRRDGRYSRRPISWCSPKAKARAGTSTRTVTDRTPRSTTRPRCVPTPSRPDQARRSSTTTAAGGAGRPATRRAASSCTSSRSTREWDFDARQQHATCDRRKESRTCWPTAHGSMFDNVVVLWIDYGHSTADARSPDGGTIGTGSAVVFTNGKQIPATWSRADRLQPIALTDCGWVADPADTGIDLVRTRQHRARHLPGNR